MQDKNVLLTPKIKLIHELVMSVFSYACKIWILTADFYRHIEIFEIRCYRKILNFSNRDYIRNVEARKRITAAIGTHDGQLNININDEMIRPGNDHPAERSAGGRKTDRDIDKAEVKQHTGIDMPIFRRVAECSSWMRLMIAGCPRVMPALVRLGSRDWKNKQTAGLVSLFNGIPTFLDYLMRKPSVKKSSGTI